jgi:hypothetical protein
MSLIGIGQLGPGPTTDPTCGDSPCGVLDWIYLSQACQNYLGCADPTNALYITATKGLIVGGTQVVSSTVGGAAGALAAGVTTGVASGAASATGIPAAVWYVGGAIAAFFLIKDLVKR